MRSRCSFRDASCQGEFVLKALNKTFRAERDDDWGDELACVDVNVFGKWARGGGCNAFSCWYPGGGCNPFGCWYEGGSCSAFGCVSESPKTKQACND